MSKRRFSLSELCTMTSQPIKTIRSLTDQGLLPCEQSGLYTEQALNILNRMSQMERLGCSHEKILAYLQETNP